MLKSSFPHCASSQHHPLAFTSLRYTHSTANIIRAGCTSQRSSSSQLSASRSTDSTNTTSPFASSALAAAISLCTLLQPQCAYALPEERLEEIRQQINMDFSEGQYYVTGKLTPSLYDDQCRFKDPTTDVKGVKPYTTAVASLFDPAVSKADLLSSEVRGSNTITLKWRLEGRLKLGNLNIKPYTGTTVYTVDEDSGLITRHTETWDISALDAFVSTFVPSFGAPPAPPVAIN